LGGHGAPSFHSLDKGNEMRKQKTTQAENIWGEDINPQTLEPIENSKTVDEQFDEEYAKLKKTTKATINSSFDIDGLMTDFPTATDLERFVYDQTGIVLNLKGRANKLKYQVAMDALNGLAIDDVLIGSDNPYIDRTELVPIDPIKEPPARDKSLPERSETQNIFYSPVIPHPDADQRAQDKKVHMMFRKYKNGMISYEILGPLEQRPHGEKIDKFGRTRPEVIKWVDPRTGEQVIMRADGTLTPQGKRLRATMQTFRVNNTNQWEVWIDREFVSMNDSVAHNPWDLSK
jgi:hypothetical protein